MAKERITEAVKKGRILVSDGAWGTFLQKKGMKPGDCPEAWCVDRPADVRDIGKSYIDAGADMIESCSFGGTSFKLTHFGHGDKVESFNMAAAKLSREAAGEKWVIASVGPTGKILMTGEVTEDDLYNAFKAQSIALEKGGADALCIETMSDLDEAKIAIRAAKENTKCEVICTFTFEKTPKGEYRTMMGVSPADAARELVAAGADIIGTNCGNGIRGMIDVVTEMRTVDTATPVLVHANAGLPKNVNGVDVFPETPEEMASQIPALLKAGANIVGGCCGTTPAHIRAMKKAVKDYRA
ncbi:MAG: homocysteine S-methyltransferase family protein [Spirochaetota bacterium]